MTVTLLERLTARSTASSSSVTRGPGRDPGGDSFTRMALAANLLCPVFEEVDGSGPALEKYYKGEHEEGSDALKR